jgi:hypothetical protein
MSESVIESYKRTQAEQAKLANEERSSSWLGFGLGIFGAGTTLALARHPSLLTIVQGLSPVEQQTLDGHTATASTLGSGALTAFGFSWGLVSLNRAARHDGRAAAIEGAVVAHELVGLPPGSEAQPPHPLSE